MANHISPKNTPHVDVYHPRPDSNLESLLDCNLSMAAPNDTRLTQVDIERKGWKYVGYRGFSRFLSSDNDFLVLRQFSALHTRVLLALQDEIVQLEAEIDAIDSTSSAKTSPDCHNGTFRADHSERRKSLLVVARQKLNEYDDLFAKFHNLRTLPYASSRSVSSIQNWLYNNGDPILPREVEYLEAKSDLVSVVAKSKSSLRLVLERFESFRLSRLWRLQSPELQSFELGDNRDVLYSSDDCMERYVSSVILILGLTMLIAPLWILTFIPDPSKRLGTITIFIAVFVCLVSFTTVAKPFESLAAAAAYSAVLMVFMQLSPS